MPVNRRPGIAKPGALGALVAMALALLAAMAAPATAATVTAPNAGVLPKAAPFTLQWTTSAPAANISVWLIQVTPTNTVIASGWPTIANTGQATLSLPPSLLCDAAHSYKIAVMVMGHVTSGHASGPTIEESAESKPFRLSCESDRTGTLTVSKTVVSDGPIPPPNIPFLVDVRCPPNGPSATVTLTSANGYQQVLAGVTPGANCTVTERPPAVPADLARRGCRWETSYPGQDTDPEPRPPSTSGPNVTRRIVNRWICKLDVAVSGGVIVPRVAIRQKSDLGIRKTGPATVYVGDTVTYVLTALNNGTLPAEPSGGGVGIMVSDAIPAGFTLISPQGTSASMSLVSGGGGWICGSPSLTCIYASGPPVPPNAAFPPIAITVRANTAGVFQQCARVTWQGGTDEVAGNNLSCLGVTIRQKPR